MFAEPGTFSAFKEAVNKVLPVIKEATAKDRALMGSKSNGIPTGPSGPLKRKRDPGPAESAAKSEYYFAKYLTSPELLDLEIADTHFRRQFLFQLLILLHHLCSPRTAYTQRHLKRHYAASPAQVEGQTRLGCASISTTGCAWNMSGKYDAGFFVRCLAHADLARPSLARL